MKIRILGTSSKKYIDNLNKISGIKGEFILVEQGEIFGIYSNELKKIVLKFRTNVTRRQNIEVWRSFGLVDFKLGKFSIKYNKRTLLDKVKENLLIKSPEKAIQSFKNTKMLAIEYFTGSLTNEIINELDIKQLRGKFDSQKLEKEISEIEKSIAKDPKFIIRLRKELYNEII